VTGACLVDTESTVSWLVCGFVVGSSACLVVTWLTEYQLVPSTASDRRLLQRAIAVFPTRGDDLLQCQATLLVIGFTGATLTILTLCWQSLQNMSALTSHENGGN